ncbi:MAG: hypothetical protein ABI960_11735 [Candidatus Eisenbacteria bacterium]
MRRLALLGTGLALALALTPAHAQESRLRPAPWVPAGIDSTRLWALEARALLDQTTTDSIGTNESRAFGLLDRLVRRSFLQLGPGGMRGARGVLTVLDSLKLDVEMVQDPDLPQFCVVTYFNSKFAGYAAWTSLFWWRGQDLMKQSLLLGGGRRIQMDVWWTGNELGPYEMALVDYRRTGEPRAGFFTMLRLSRQGEFWGAVQYAGTSIDLGGPGQARLVDLDNDGVPELAQWATSEPDARFVPDMNLPPILSERIWRRTDAGFRLLEKRTVATPFTTFVLFLRALEGGQAALARSLAATPAIYAKALSLRLGAFHAAKSWRASEPAPGERWAESMRFQYGTPARLEHGLEVRMKEVEGHWLVAGLAPLALGPPTAGAPPGGPKSGAKPGAKPGAKSGANSGTGAR